MKIKDSEFLKTSARTIFTSQKKIIFFCSGAVLQRPESHRVEIAHGGIGFSPITPVGGGNVSTVKLCVL